MRHYDFDKVIDRSGSGAIKVDAVEKVFGKVGLTPMWVADMDFETPEFIIDALKQRLEHPVFGYTAEPKDFRPSIMDWINDHHGWKIESEWISYIPGIVKGIGMAINALAGWRQMNSEQHQYSPLLLPLLHSEREKNGESRCLAI